MAEDRVTFCGAATETSGVERGAKAISESVGVVEGSMLLVCSCVCLARAANILVESVDRNQVVIGTNVNKSNVDKRIM